MADLFSAAELNMKDALATYQRIGKEWGKLLDFSTLLATDSVLNTVANDAKQYQIYPSPGNVFRIYNDLPLHKVKVVILGQDPYHNGNANGYAFGCAMTRSSSLAQIFKAMNNNLQDTDLSIKRENTLKYLVDQGVFLLNTILTVRYAQPLSHEEIGWDRLITNTIQLLNQTPRVWMLWGSSAGAYSKWLTNRKNLVLLNEHPVAASYRNQTWECDHFYKANAWLIENNQTPIQW